MGDFNYGNIIFSNRSYLFSSIERPEQKSFAVNSYNYTRPTRGSLKAVGFSNSNVSILNQDKRVSPLRLDRIKRDDNRDLSLTPAAKMMMDRIKTDESERPNKLETSFDCFMERQKIMGDKRRKFNSVQRKPKEPNINRIGRNSESQERSSYKRQGEEYPSSIRRKGMLTNLVKKRPSVYTEKHSANTYIDSSPMPAIFVNGSSKHQKKRLPSIKIPSFNSETSDLRILESLNIATAAKLPQNAENGSHYFPKVFDIRSENFKTSKARTRQNNSVASCHVEDSLEESCFAPSYRNSSLYLGEMTPSRARNTDFQALKKKDVNLLEAVNDSLQIKHQTSHSFSIDYAFDKVTELTNKNNIARYDLLKIQESALDLKMILNNRKSHIQKPAREISKPTRGFLEGVDSSDSFFVVNSEF